MKKTVWTLIAMAIVICSCTKNNLADICPPGQHVFTASFENVPDTRTYLNSDLFMCWNSDDTVSIFTSSLNEAYSFDGRDGDTGGTFSKVEGEVGKFVTGQKINANYSIYPYHPLTNMESEGTFTITLPEIQKYEYGSFAQGSNTMVAVTSSLDDYFLNFKNVCGYLVVKLYGTYDDGEIKQIIVKANNGEKIAGTATLHVSKEGDPTVNFHYFDDKESIVLDFEYGESIGYTYNDPASAAEFWFCIPPVTFSEGFTVTVVSTDGRYMSRSTNSTKTINRNVINYMAPMKLSFENDIEYAEFEDPNLEELIVAKFDIDHDDRINSWEADLVQSVNLYTQYYYYHGIGKFSSFFSSIKGLEFFANLKEIRQCPIQTASLDLTPFKSLEYFSLEYSRRTSVSSIDCSGLDKLKDLAVIGYGQKNSDSGGYSSEGNLVSLKLEGCSSLQELYCYFNKNLSEVDLSDCPELTEFSAYWCNLSSVDLTHNPKMKTVYLTGNPISTIDLSQNPDLEWAAFLGTDMVSLDISHNTKLKTLYSRTPTIIGEGSSLELFETGTDDFSENHYTVSFKNLKEFHFWQPEGVEFEYIDLSACTQLETFWTSWRPLKSIIFGSSAASIKTLIIDHISGDLAIDFSQFTSLEKIDCSGGTFKSLDVSMLSTLKTLYCQDSPELNEIWLKEGQVIEDFVHDESLQIRYK